MKLGTNTISTVKLGTNQVQKVYLGMNEVWANTDPDYQAILDYATTQGYTLPSAGQQALQNQLVVDLKTAGVWSDLDLFYVFATDGDSDFATINWKDVNNFQCTKVNSPNFTTNVGFNSNGTSSYLNTNFNVNSDSINFQLLSNSLHYYIVNNAVPSVQHGARQANDVNQILYADSLKRHQGNASNFPLLNSSSNQFFSSIRNITSTQQYLGNTLNRTQTNTPITLPNLNYYICANNNNGTLDVAGSSEIAFFSMGDQISNATMYTAWTTYFNAL
jgi:hypothetical protein